MKKCVLFAGVVGCSKTPVAVYLSHMLGLPVYNNDAIRSEVIEDLGSYDEEEFRKRAYDRIKLILKNGGNIIFDVSIDREYERVFKMLEESNYEYYLISFDLSEEFLLELYESKGYDEFIKKIDEWISDHEDFLDKHANCVDLVINDDNFKDRLSLSLQAADYFFKK